MTKLSEEEESIVLTLVFWVAMLGVAIFIIKLMGY